MRENPKGSSEGESRMFRGGSWGDGAALCRVANRYSFGATYTYGFLGFRVAAAPAVQRVVKKQTEKLEGES